MVIIELIATKKGNKRKALKINPYGYSSNESNGNDKPFLDKYLNKKIKATYKDESNNEQTISSEDFIIFMDKYYKFEDNIEKKKLLLIKKKKKKKS